MNSARDKRLEPRTQFLFVTEANVALEFGAERECGSCRSNNALRAQCLGYRARGAPGQLAIIIREAGADRQTRAGPRGNIPLDPVDAGIGGVADEGLVRYVLVERRDLDIAPFDDICGKIDLKPPIEQPQLDTDFVVLDMIGSIGAIGRAGGRT